MVAFLHTAFTLRKLAANVILFTAPLIFVALQAGATTSGITYHGRLVESDGATPISGVVQFKLQIRTPDSTDCLLYEE